MGNESGDMEVDIVIAGGKLSANSPSKMNLGID